MLSQMLLQPGPVQFSKGAVQSVSWRCYAGYFNGSLAHPGFLQSGHNRRVSYNYAFCAIQSVNIIHINMIGSIHNSIERLCTAPVHSSDCVSYSGEAKGRSTAAWGQRAVSANTAALFMFKICYSHVSVQVSGEGVEFKCDGTKLIF